jgi:predicted transcriptional regulator
MNQDIFDQIGLNKHQAAAYKFLLKNGPAPPPLIAKTLKLSRSNAYKVLDSLAEKSLVSRAEIDKKLTYKAEDPIVLTSLVSEERNKVIALERNVKNGLKELRQIYQQTVSDSAALSYRGAPAIKSLYEHQAELKQPIYIIQGRADRISMGFESMNYIRFLAKKYETPRFGITPDVPEAPDNPKLDERSNLKRTWIESGSYLSPVEWTVSGDELMIINFEDPITGIRIKDAAIADSFKQLWQALDKNLKANPQYKKLPRKAKRKV